MTTSEFSNTFDTLLNSYGNKAEFGDQASRHEIVLDEYEKSVLLTQAQDIIVKQYFERTNVNLGFDDSERRQIDFSNIITSAVKSIGSATSGFAENSWVIDFPNAEITIDSTTNPVSTIPSKPLFILNERLVLTKTSNPTKVYVIIPINYKEYDRQMSKPFAQPLKKQAWRLIQDDGGVLAEDNAKVEIIPTDEAYSLKKDGGYTAEYKVRFVRRPRPIILTSLGENLSIDGITSITECELNPIIHMDILNKAVELAYTTRGNNSVKDNTQKQ